MSFRFSGFFGTELPACLATRALGIRTLGDAVDATELAARRYTNALCSPEVPAFVAAGASPPGGQRVFVSPKVRISDRRAPMAANALVLCPVLEDGVAGLTVEGRGIAAAALMLGGFASGAPGARPRVRGLKKVADFEEIAAGTLFALPFDVIRCEPSADGPDGPDGPDGAAARPRVLVEIVFSRADETAVALSGRHVYVIAEDRLRFAAGEQIFVYESNGFSVLASRSALDVLPPEEDPKT